MATFSWRDVRLNEVSYQVKSGDHQLALRRCYRNPEGTPILMVSGFGHTGEVFWPNSAQAGLAPFLADAGYDVYVAELRGKGRSWPTVSSHADWGVHELITQDIPAHLAQITQLRPDEPQFWFGQGLGSLLLSGCYGRLDKLPAPLLGMVHFGVARRCELNSLFKSLQYMGWQLSARLCGLLLGRTSMAADSGESARVLADVQSWHQSARWQDSQDEFNYRVALKHRGLPPSLYFSLARDSLWGGVNDTRCWISELGDHDTQLMTLGRSGGNLRNYTSATLLTHPDACKDHFIGLQDWLQSKKFLASSL